ncbi:MAG: putative ABC transporter permease subunit [Saccharofermentanales bacterium]
MKRIFLLAKTLIKGSGVANFSGDTEGKKKRFGKVGMILLLTFVGIYMGALGVIFVFGGYDLLSPLGLESLIITLAMSAASFIVFFFGLFYVMSVFYFSNDVVKLLPLPFKPGEIITAKFINTLFYEYLVIIVMLLPAMAAYGILSSAPLLYYVYAVLVLLLLPVIPLVLASIIIMAIMRFAPAARNKDRFTMIGGLFALVLGLGMNFGIQSVMSRSSGADLAALLSKSADAVASVSSRLFPGTYFANYALSKPDGLDSFLMILIFAGLTALFFAVLYFIANLLYFKGVIGISDSVSRGKKMTDAEIAETSSRGSAVGTYVLKELRILFRTPIFFMNNVLMNFLMPVIIVIPLFLGESGNEEFSIKMIQNLMTSMTSTGDLKYAAYILLGLFGFIMFTAGTNGITESAISRDGNCAYLMKIIPMSYKSQILAKILTGIALSFCGALIIYIIFIIILAPPAWFALACLAIIPGAVLLPNISGMIFDLYMPKIKWDNEQKAVKQNMNVLYGMLFAGICIGLTVVPVVKLELPFPQALIFISVFPLVLAALSAYFVSRITNRCMIQLAA